MEVLLRIGDSRERPPLLAVWPLVFAAQPRATNPQQNSQLRQANVLPTLARDFNL